MSLVEPLLPPVPAHDPGAQLTGALVPVEDELMAFQNHFYDGNVFIMPAEDSIDLAINQLKRPLIREAFRVIKKRRMEKKPLVPSEALVGPIVALAAIAAAPKDDETSSVLKSYMQVVGATKQRGPDRPFPAVKYVKAVSDLPKTRIEQIGNNATFHFCVGTFNPMEIMNAQLTLNSTTWIGEEWSSAWISKIAVNTAGPVQWPTPKPLLEMQGVTIESLHHYYNCEFVRLALEFTNISDTSTMHVWYKLYYPGSQNSVNWSSAMDDAATLNTGSDRGLVFTSATGKDPSYAAEYTTATVKNFTRLNSTRGMYKMVLGPNSANGLPNVARTGMDINVKKILNESNPDFIRYTGNTEVQDIEKMVHVANSLDKTGSCHMGSNVPIVLFFAAEVTNGGLIKPVANDDLFVRGRAEYTVRLFGSNALAAATPDNPTT